MLRCCSTAIGCATKSTGLSAGRSMIAFDFGPKFQLDRVVITRNAQAAIPHDEVLLAIKRHSRGDWGELDSHDVAENERSLQGSGRLFSAYRTRDGVRFYVITEGDRSVTNAKTQHLVTTILLPEDY